MTLNFNLKMYILQNIALRKKISWHVYRGVHRGRGRIQWEGGVCAWVVAVMQIKRETHKILSFFWTFGWRYTNKENQFNLPPPKKKKNERVFKLKRKIKLTPPPQKKKTEWVVKTVKTRTIFLRNGMVDIESNWA